MELNVTNLLVAIIKLFILVEELRKKINGKKVPTVKDANYYSKYLAKHYRPRLKIALSLGLHFLLLHQHLIDISGRLMSLVKSFSCNIFTFNIGSS